MSVTQFRTLDFDALASQARRNHLSMLLAIEASEDNDEAFAMREPSPEEFVDVLREAGAIVDVKLNPLTGEIDEITASVPLLKEGDGGIVQSIDATGPTPAKILGDLAQTSVTTGVSGSTTETQVIGLAEWTLSWKRKTADATTTDDDTYESSLGSTASWSVKAKYMFIDGDTSQSTYILATITTPQSPMTWNFFPTIGTGRAAFQGDAYVDGIDIATGMGKVVGLDVSLKGTGKLNFIAQVAPVANPNTGTGQQAED